MVYNNDKSTPLCPLVWLYLYTCIAMRNKTIRLYLAEAVHTMIIISCDGVLFINLSTPFIVFIPLPLPPPPQLFLAFLFHKFPNFTSPSLGFVCNPCVLSANRVDFGLFCFINFPISPPPPHRWYSDLHDRTGGCRSNLHTSRLGILVSICMLYTCTLFGAEGFSLDF